MVINYLLNGMILQVVMGLPKTEPDLSSNHPGARCENVSFREDNISVQVIFHPKKKTSKTKQKDS